MARRIGLSLSALSPERGRYWEGRLISEGPNRVDGSEDDQSGGEGNVNKHETIDPESQLLARAQASRDVAKALKVGERGGKFTGNEAAAAAKHLG